VNASRTTDARLGPLSRVPTGLGVLMRENNEDGWQEDGRLRVVRLAFDDGGGGGNKKLSVRAR
jgi:hypothetical protein